MPPKFLNQNKRQFRLHYVRGPIDTRGSRIRMAQTLRQDVSLGTAAPNPCICVPGLFTIITKTQQHLQMTFDAQNVINH